MYIVLGLPDTLSTGKVVIFIRPLHPALDTQYPLKGFDAKDVQPGLCGRHVGMHTLTQVPIIS